MNGWVALLAVSSSASAGLGILAGRYLERPNSFGAGMAQGRMAERMDAQPSARQHQADAHGHSIYEECTSDCYGKLRE